jgi:hypothetical protein
MIAVAAKLKFDWIGADFEPHSARISQHEIEGGYQYDEDHYGA